MKRGWIQYDSSLPNLFFFVLVVWYVHRREMYSENNRMAALGRLWLFYTNQNDMEIIIGCFFASSMIDVALQLFSLLLFNLNSSMMLILRNKNGLVNIKAEGRVKPFQLDIEWTSVSYHTFIEFLRVLSLLTRH